MAKKISVYATDETKFHLAELARWWGLGERYNSGVVERCVRQAYEAERPHYDEATRWDALTVELSAKNSQALLLCPMFIGADSIDITTFVVDVWAQPVTDANYLAVAQAFRRWYAEVAPDEYHDPEPTQALRAMGYGNPA